MKPPINQNIYLKFFLTFYLLFHQYYFNFPIYFLLLNFIFFLKSIQMLNADLFNIVN